MAVLEDEREDKQHVIKLNYKNYKEQILNIKLKLKRKKVLFTIEKIKEDYTQIYRHLALIKTKPIGNSAINKIISAFEKLRGLLNINKLIVYENAKVKAKYIINKGLTKDNKIL